MKNLIIFSMLLILTACTSKEVRMTDPNLEMKGFELYYKEEPFTGTVIQQIPLTDSELRIKYKNGIPTAQDFDQLPTPE